MTKVYQVSFKHFYLIGVYFETLGRHLIGLNQTVKTAVIQNYAGFEQKLTWLIEHCANVTEDTYIVQHGIHWMAGCCWMGVKTFVSEKCCIFLATSKNCSDSVQFVLMISFFNFITRFYNKNILKMKNKTLFSSSPPCCSHPSSSSAATKSQESLD